MSDDNVQESPIAPVLGLSVFGPGRIHLVIDVNDPETPAMVYATHKRIKMSSTFDCALGTGTVGSTEDVSVDLTPDQQRWLLRFEDRVAAAYDYARRDRDDSGRTKARP